MFDALVIGTGPAGLTMAAALCARGLSVQGLSPKPPTEPWVNTFGIWEDELDALGLTGLLSHRWPYSVSYFSQGEVNHQRTYGLLDKRKLQSYFLEDCQKHGVRWHQGHAATLDHHSHHSSVTTHEGDQFQARVVIDASGHQPVFVKRSLRKTTVAYQAAYGIVGRFTHPPIAQNQFVLMDYRSDHLTAADKAQDPPTFLYAMDLGNDVFFVEETSLAAAPPVGFDVLERRLHQRLQARGVEVVETHEVERCLFPMNLPMPDLRQPVIGFGGAASMVHPASGYMIGSLLRRSPDVADAIAMALVMGNPSPQTLARSAWKALWPQDQLRKYYLYRFGLEKLMRFEEARLHHFFETFFSLPQEQWTGFLANTLTTPELVQAMIHLFALAPNDVRWGLMKFAEREAPLLWRSITA
ncbi:lycopene beta cyclase [Lyngbya confervoides]|uniref:Lycopene cyclase family protein n=1 Tax=Lyngbya confervoides BDU141951 TaxID=1574623 RepID=A0ABD4SZP5_9CYAN|nr:lycopene cyclase family protein [Lyngbya confervoides]MCM1981901.1 lycopene cyclase family protein [Lyngbya confervoides BDU141951]